MSSVSLKSAVRSHASLVVMVKVMMPDWATMIVNIRMASSLFIINPT